jgi:hypothetical protein
MSTSRSVARIATFVAVAGLVVGTGHTGAGAVAHLPLQIDLKDRLDLAPAKMAGFFAVASIPWDLKPFASAITDVFPIGGSRRRAYLVAAVIGAALSWAAFAFTPRSFGVMLAAALGVEVCVMLASVVLGGVLVEAGQRVGATGRLTSVRMTAIFGGGLAAGPIGGWLATRPLLYTAALAIGLQAALLIASLTCVEEPVVTEPLRLKDSLERLIAMFKSKQLVVSAIVGFLVLTAPGFGTPLLYRQTEELRHSAQFVGLTRMGGTLAAGAVAVAYGVLCRRVRLRHLLVVGVVAHAVSALLFLFFGSPTWQAMAIFSTYSGCTALVLLPLWDLSARAAPAGYEGLAYALMMSALNLAHSTSDVLGSILHDRWGVGFTSLVWLNSASTIAVLLLVPLLPAAIMDRADRLPAESA